VNLHFPMLCIWSIGGNSVVRSWQPGAVNGPHAKLNKIFFLSNSCRSVTFVKFGFLIENTARCLKQCLLCVRLFLSVMLNMTTHRQHNHQVRCLFTGHLAASTGITVPLEKTVQWERLEEASNAHTV
jgi:hypothetical protein